MRVHRHGLGSGATARVMLLCALMLTLARTGRIDKLSGGLAHSDDFVAVKQRMASFMAAGFRAICR